MKFSGLSNGVAFTFVNQPDQMFTTMIPLQPAGFPDSHGCPTCGETPLMLNAYEIVGGHKVFHHFCPDILVTTASFGKDD